MNVCAVTGCGTEIAGHKVFCECHWTALPGKAQRRICGWWRRMHHGEPGAKARYHGEVRDAALTLMVPQQLDLAGPAR